MISYQVDINDEIHLIQLIDAHTVRFVVPERHGDHLYFNPEDAVTLVCRYPIASLDTLIGQYQAAHLVWLHRTHESRIVYHGCN